VTLGDLVQVTKLQPLELEGEIHQLGLFVGVNWAGRDAVSVTDAHALVTGSARRALEREQAWRRHQDATEAWEASRQHARRSAFDLAYNDALRRGVGNAAAQDPAQEAARQAVERFEAKNPPPTFEGNTSARTWFGRAADKIRETVS
jgi:hypothetical protein